MKQRTKRILVVGDMHCGHQTGLTPPDWWWDDSGEVHERHKIAAYQRWAWKTYSKYLDELRPFDRMIVMGDCIDGKGQRSGGNELITTDRDEQVDMAAICIKAAKTPEIAIALGTQYHTGVDEDWEKAVAREVKADEVGNKLYPEINGVVLDVRHFVGGTTNPKSKATSVLGAQVSNDQWCREYKDHPEARIFLRGHVHRYIAIDEPSTLSITTPSLQGWTKFGAAKCDLPIHFGIVVIEITGAGNWTFTRKIAQLGQFVHTLKW